MNKKGATTHWLGLLPALLLGLAAFFYYYTISENPITGKYIGDFQINLIRNLQKGENVLFYIDQSAKYALQQAVYELAQNGGVSEIESIGSDENFADYQCGRFNDAYVWYELKKDASKITENECFDEKSIDIHLMHYFNENLNEFLQNNPHNILVDNYKYEVKGNLEIIGIAQAPLEFDILKEVSEKIIEISSKPKEFIVDAEGKEIKEKKDIELDKIKSVSDFTKVNSVKTPKAELEFDVCSKGRKCILTKGAYALLIEAQKIAKQKGVSLDVTSSYRTIEQQKAIWNGDTSTKYNIRYPLEKDRREYVCYPYGNDVEKRCAHLTGNAVDIRFKGKTFKTMTSENWALLHKIMTDAGWVRYTNEPWHFECCGTDRYLRAKALEKQTGKPVTAIV